MSRIKSLGWVVGIVFFAIFAFSLTVVPTSDQVQAAVITPVVNVGRDGSRVATYFSSQAITADTRVCFDLADKEIIDLQYRADATLSNATTLTFQQTNIDPTTGPFNSAAVIATIPLTPADADAFSQQATFGRWNCVFADVTNTNPVTLTVIGVAK